MGKQKIILFQWNTAILQDDLYIDSFHFLPGFDDCFEAESNIVIENSEVFSGADVKFVAGNSIRFLPATTIESGAQLLAKIDTDGNYCSNYKSILADNTVIPSDTEYAEPGDKEVMFRVYPNPTRGRFTLELTELKEFPDVVIEIYSILGERVHRFEPAALKQYEFDLSNHQPGIYLIRVMMGDEVGVERLVKM
jgi:hypothetical protein